MHFIKIDFWFQGKPLDVSWGKRSCWTCVFVTEQVSILFSFASIAILNFPWQTHFLLIRKPDWLDMEPFNDQCFVRFPGNSKTPIHICQCSPHQAVTSRINHLKQHFLPPATPWRFTKIKEVLIKNTQVVIQSDSHMPQGNEWMYGKVLKYRQLFFLWAKHFGKRTLKTE